MAKNEAIKEKANVTGEMVGEMIKSAMPTFTKEQLVKSKKYEHRRDALNALLQDGKAYSYAQVDEILNKFDKGVR
ncbi:hypothetical protein R6U77_00695 [Lysinibacillus louembei]|uniref:Uncharacterized protein n=1 Tax=Lysinibacillus louembei TaxID=1470088 RepID=A0ABZ0RVG9_9BACI|nr:hypothetical protein [Lysinibacillus louembei]WPK12237.1 hypothetical protein R6U77_00695 [Lysinibacillus louembei]